MLSWIIFYFSFGAVWVATEQIAAGFGASCAESFEVACEGVRPFLLLCLLLFLMLIVNVGTVLLVSQAILWLALRPLFGQLSSLTTSLISYAAFGLGVLLLSRFALAVPALILDDCKVGQGIVRSGRLTRNKAPILAVLLFKSIVRGYVAGVLPFWLAGWTPASAHLPSWFGWVLTGVSVAAVTIVEPVMFIGFQLPYLKTSAVSSESAAQAVSC